MIKNSLLILFLSCTSFFYSHEYYFAFAEVEYNDLNGVLQATVVVSTHDFEMLLREKGIINKDLSSYSDNPDKLTEIQNEVLKGFTMHVGEEELILIPEGMEVQLTGITNFYFSVKNVPSTKNFLVKFDLLMHEIPAQQNKLTFIYRNVKNTYVFLSQKREQELILTEK